MREYMVTTHEVVIRTYTVQAKSEEKAHSKVEKMVKKGVTKEKDQILLDDEDWRDWDIVEVAPVAK